MHLPVVSILNVIFILKQTRVHSRLTISLAEFLGRVSPHPISGGGLELQPVRWGKLINLCSGSERLSDSSKDTQEVGEEAKFRTHVF